mgnify:CR=1 FL=1
MSAALLGLLAETHIHPGAGQDDGTVDLPVVREKTTSYPFVPGSSVKGAIRDAVGRQRDEDTVKHWFGVQDNAGLVMVSDARLLLLPVRSLTGAYRWLTCPYLVERLLRDLRRVGQPYQGAPLTFDVATVDEPRVMTKGKGRLFLEERVFTIPSAPSNDLVKLLQSVIGDPQASARLGDQLAVVSDDDFAWFARYGLSVQARNCLQSRDGKSDAKTSTNLWYEETLAPDTVMYLLLSDRYQPDGKGGADAVAKLFTGGYLQLGGNETVGQGWFQVTVLTGATKEDGGTK